MALGWDACGSAIVVLLCGLSGIFEARISASGVSDIPMSEADKFWVFEKPSPSNGVSVPAGMAS